MKTYKLIAICIASLFFGACSDGLDEAVGLHVKVATNEKCKLRRTDHYCQKRYSDRVHPFGRCGLPDILQWRSGQQIRISRTRND